MAARVHPALASKPAATEGQREWPSREALLLPPVPCITHDVGRGAERGSIFFHQMCRGDGPAAPTERCAVLMPSDESTLGFWLLGRSDPCCYCYRKI